MLTESQNFIEEKYPAVGAKRDILLYGKEINDETYAICKSDMMIKGNDPANIKVGSTLSTDEFASVRFDFMLSNPPYGKSWASEQKNVKEGTEVIDPRFKVQLADYWGTIDAKGSDATPRSSDGQLLFLMEMVNKMKSPSVSPLGSRIASVHNGSSLFTGDAGSGESNIRRYLIENDMLEAIVQLPNNLFYNTGITTYIWLLNNHKPAHRQGKVQLIDASLLYRKLRKNLGDKNCEFSPEHIEEITNTYLACADVERQLDSNDDPVGIASKVVKNEDFGYYKVTVERPDRRKAQFSRERLNALRFDKSLNEVMEYCFAEYGEQVYQDGFLTGHSKPILEWCEKNEISLNNKAKEKLLSTDLWCAARSLFDMAHTLMQEIGEAEFNDFNLFKAQVEATLDSLDVLVLVNPNNPTGRRVPRERLLDWHARLAARGGWLLVDEAFMDNTPAQSVVDCAERPGLIVLRSFGKFFGLAGVRVGFVFAAPELLRRMQEALGPWSIAGPTRVLGQACLLDHGAQQRQITRCAEAGTRLAQVLDAAGFTPAGGCDLFQYLELAHAAQLHQFMARRGILLRLFAESRCLRFGLPADEAGWQRLEQALQERPAWPL